MKKISFIITLATAILLVQCSGDNNVWEKDATGQHADEHANVNAATLTAEQIKSVVWNRRYWTKAAYCFAEGQWCTTGTQQNKASISSVYRGVVKIITGTTRQYCL